VRGIAEMRDCGKAEFRIADRFDQYVRAELLPTQKFRIHAIAESRIYISQFRNS